MTDLRDGYKHLDSMSQVQLLERRTALIGSAPNGDYHQLSDEVLQELVAIHRVMRRHSGGGKPKTTRTVYTDVPTPDML